MHNHVLSASASIWYKDWQDDVESWMLADKQVKHTELLERGDRWKAQKMRSHFFYIYRYKISRSHFFLHMLIQQPFLNRSRELAERSAERPAEITELIKELTSGKTRNKDPAKSVTVADELRWRSRTQAECDQSFDADNEANEAAASADNPKPKKLPTKRRYDRASHSWGSAEQPARYRHW